MDFAVGGLGISSISTRPHCRGKDEIEDRQGDNGCLDCAPFPAGLFDNAVDLDDELYGAAFRRYLLFSRWPSLLTEEGLRLSEEEIVCNSYYWLLKFSKLRAVKGDYDAGIEQQVFKILEQACCDVDWHAIEQIDNLVEKEMGEWK